MAPCGGPLIPHHGRARLEMLHNRAEKGRLDMIPFDCIGLGHSHEIGAKKYRRYAINRENARGKWRFIRRLARWKIGCAHVQNGLPWQKLQRGWVRGGFRLNKHW